MEVSCIAVSLKYQFTTEVFEMKFTWEEYFNQLLY